MSVAIYFFSKTKISFLYVGGIQCTFESPNLCGWTQDTTDQFDWTPKAGHTTSSGTGPSADHTSGTATGN